MAAGIGAQARLRVVLAAVEQHGVSFGGHFSDGQLDGIVFPGEAWPARGVAGLPPYSQVSEMLPGR